MNAHHVWWVGEIVSNCYLAKGFVGLLQMILQQLKCQVKEYFFVHSMIAPGHLDQMMAGPKYFSSSENENI